MHLAKLEGDNTNVEFLNCSQGRDALRTVTKSIAAKCKDVKVRQKNDLDDLLASHRDGGDLRRKHSGSRVLLGRDGDLGARVARAQQ